MDSMPHHRRRRAPSERERIRELFLARRPSYTFEETRDLVGVDEEVMRAAIAEGTIEATRTGEALRIAWDDLVVLGLNHRWTYRILTAALRDAGAPLLPPLVQGTPGRVELPRYQWQLLGQLAERRAREERRELTVSDLLEEAATEFLARIDDDTWGSLPGARAAAAWPLSD